MTDKLARLLEAVMDDEDVVELDLEAQAEEDYWAAEERYWDVDCDVCGGECVL